MKHKVIGTKDNWYTVECGECGASEDLLIIGTNMVKPIHTCVECKIEAEIKLGRGIRGVLRINKPVEGLVDTKKSDKPAISAIVSKSTGKITGMKMEYPPAETKTVEQVVVGMTDIDGATRIQTKCSWCGQISEFMQDKGHIIVESAYIRCCSCGELGKVRMSEELFRKKGVSDLAAEGEQELKSAMQIIADRCHKASYAAGWWHHAGSGLPYIPGDNCTDGTPWVNLRPTERELITEYWPMVVATKIALIHSETSEALEAFRRDANDDKLAHRLGIEVELADSVIRQFDLNGAIYRADELGVIPNFDNHEPPCIPTAIFEKMDFNASRSDHTLKARTGKNGKRF